MDSDQYKTIAGQSTGLYKEKGSKFIAIATHVSDVEDVSAQLELTKKNYHDARHHCYAYRLGPQGDDFRYNDDGEPSGSAGRPIHGQLLSAEITNCLVVVVRYFGGTKLGVGGLVTAYKTAARDALDTAKIRVETVTGSVELNFPYTLMNDVMRIIKEEKLKIAEQEFFESCRIKVDIRKKDFIRVRERFSKLHLLDLEDAEDA